jgi:hypothetical protein
MPTGFATTADKIIVDAFGTATTLTTVTGVQTYTVNIVYPWVARQREPQIRSLILLWDKQLQERGLIATLSYIIAADNYSTAAYSYTGDEIEDNFTAAEFTLMGRMDAFMSLCTDDVS